MSSWYRISSIPATSFCLASSTKPQHRKKGRTSPPSRSATPTASTSTCLPTTHLVLPENGRSLTRRPPVNSAAKATTNPQRHPLRVALLIPALPARVSPFSHREEGRNESQ